MRIINFQKEWDKLAQVSLSNDQESEYLMMPFFSVEGWGKGLIHTRQAH